MTPKRTPEEALGQAALACECLFLLEQMYQMYGKP